MIPARMAYVGRIHLSGYVFDSHLLGEATARARVLHCWRPGARLWRRAGCYVLELPRARWCSAPWLGAPLVRAGQWLSMAPLSAAELQQVQAAPGEILWVQGGALEAWSPSGACSPSQWLELGLCTPEVVDLGVQVQVQVQERLAPERAVFGVRVASKEQAAALASLQTLGTGEPRSGLGLGLAKALARGLAGLRGLLPQSGAAGSELSSRPAEVSWIGQQLDALERQLSALVMRLGLGHLVGQKHREFLGRLLSQLEQQDWEEALRNAIPLGGAGGAEGWLREPGRRTSLRPSLTPGRGGSTTYMEDDLYQRLNRLYKKAAQDLEEQGRLEEAAFVWTDLLAVPSRAVDLLLRHQRYRLAARIAEGHGLPVAQTVRIWFLAGEVERAVALARLHGAFEGCVRLLEEEHPAEALAMRLAWGGAMAELGQLEQAVLAVWPIERARERVARAWMEQVIGRGGAPGGRMLLLAVRTWPQDFQGRAVALARSRGRSELEGRLALARGLPGSASTPEMRVLARVSLRGAVSDNERFGGLGRKGLQKLRRATGSLALAADMPAVGPQRALQPLRWSAHDRGGAPILDAVLVPGGRVWTAHGHLGLRLSDPQGVRLMQVEVPAHHLVVDLEAGKGLVLSPLGDGLMRVSTLDLYSGECRVWLELPLVQWCERFCRGVWVVAVPSEKVENAHTILALDLRAQVPLGIWRREPEGRVYSLTHDPQTGLWATVHVDGGLQSWRWTASLGRLLARAAMGVLSELSELPVQLAAQSGAWFGQGQWVSEVFGELKVGGPTARRDYQGVLAGRAAFGLDQGLFLPVRAVAPPDGDSRVIETAISLHQEKSKRIMLRAQGGERLDLRMQSSVLLAFDDLGRLAILEWGRPPRDLRLS